MWMYPTNAGAFIHGLVDRILEGDAKAEEQISRLRRELGL